MHADLRFISIRLNIYDLRLAIGKGKEDRENGHRPLSAWPDQHHGSTPMGVTQQTMHLSTRKIGERFVVSR